MRKITRFLGDFFFPVARQGHKPNQLYGHFSAYYNTFTHQSVQLVNENNDLTILKIIQTQYNII